MFNPKSLLFDSDGVVVDSEIARDEILRKVLLDLGVQYQRDRTKPKLSGKSELEMMNILIKEYELQVSPQEISAMRKEALGDLYQNKVGFVPDFLNLYHSLKNNFNAKIAIVSGCETSLFRGVDRRLKIFELADGNVFLSHDLSIKSKPSPDIFLYALKHMDVKPEDSVVFEDAPNGIVASIAAEIPKTVAITRTFQEDILRRETMSLSGIPDSTLDRKVLFIPDYSQKSIDRVLEYMRM